MKVGLILFHGNALVSFSVVNIVNILSEQGHHVYLFLNRRRDWGGVSNPDVHPGVQIHYFDTHTQSYSYSRQNLLDILRLARYVSSKAVRYDVIIGVDQDAFIAAAFVKLFRKARKLVYLSLEIILKADYAGKGGYFLIKHWLETMTLRQAKQLWIQDRFRGKALVEDLGVPDFPLTILPHSPRRVRSAETESTYLRTKYQIPDASTILVYTGGIDPVYCCVELAEMAANSPTWPEDAVLIMHGFGGDIHLRKLESLQNARFRLSTQLVSFAELDDLIASADIGIALFNPTLDTNHRLMASGKIMNYLKAGLPVLATGTPTTRDVLDRHQAGVCIEHLSELPNAYHTILADYARYATNAAKTFASEYEFDKNFQRAWTQLTSHA